MSHRTRIIRWRTRVAFNLNAVLGAGVHTLATRLFRVTRDFTVKLVEVDATFGVRDDPTDEEIMFMIGLADPANLPTTFTTLPFWSDWIKVQRWRSIGTDSGPIQTMQQHETEDIQVTYAVESNDAFRSSTIVATVRSDTTSSVRYSGHVEIEIEYRQHTYNNFTGVSQAEVEQWQIMENS